MIPNTTPARRVARLERAVRGWLAEHRMVEDYDDLRGFRLLSEEEWRGRGEPWPADLVMISEGELARLWEADPCFDREPLRSLREAAWDLGFYPELGYAWSLHFHFDP
jgi:hypothetical protein